MTPTELFEPAAVPTSTARRPTSSPAPSTDDRTTPTPRELLAQMGDPLDPSSYDWSLARTRPPTTEEVFQLTYAAQVEWATEGTFASLDISTDPLVREFLDTWLAQEVVHGELLARFLSEGGTPVQPLHTTARQRRAARRGRLVNQVAHRVIGDDFFAVHMMWGAINELTTLRFYRLIRRNSDNELLRAILRDLIVQESLHYSFYRAMAIERLEGNPRGQRLVRFALEHLWSVVGVGLRSRRDADRLLLGLLDHESAQVDQIDASINRVPGLVGLDLISRTLDRARRDAARPCGEVRAGRIE